MAAATPLELALEYIGRGYSPVPVPYKTKHPKLQRWQKLRITAETAERYFNGELQNVGVLFGPASQGLTDIDLDSREAIRLAREFLPTTQAVFGRASKPTSHWEYITDLSESEKKARIAFVEPKALNRNGEDVTLLEVRIGGGGKGSQSIYPGSVHESGEAIRWERDGEPAKVAGTELLRAAERLAAAALLVRHYPNEGSRHTAALVLGGVLAREGWSVDAIATFVESVAHGANDPEWRDRVKGAASAVELFAKGGNTPGLPRMAEVWGEELTKLFARWLLKRYHSHRVDRAVTLDDFYAYMPQHSYIFAPSRELWPAASVNSRIGLQPLLDEAGNPIRDETGRLVRVRASLWLDRNRSCEQMTWSPGDPEIVESRLVSQGGWIERQGCRVFNLYRPPTLIHGDPCKAGIWIKHVEKIYPDDAAHIIAYLAHRVQRPHEKINHALLLGGAQGIGKDSLLEPIKGAVGPWNFTEISPQHLLGRFNGFLKSVILRVSEARDLGDINRYSFYEHMKAYTAAPPDVLRVDEKHIKEYSVFNVCAVIITSNHKTNGLYIPNDDRRHYAAWSELTKDDFTPEYWRKLWAYYYEEDGIRHVAAYLADYDLSSFDPKAPPPKTEAWHAIVNASRSPDDAELADILDVLGNPDVVTLKEIIAKAQSPFLEFLQDRKSSRVIAHRLEACDYVALRNTDAKDGLWKIDGQRRVIYGKSTLSRAQLDNARRQKYACDPEPDQPRGW
jgi:hypothetical protein